MNWAGLVLVSGCSAWICASAAVGSLYGLERRPAAKPYLQMPENENGPIPKLLSQTGAFQDLRSLTPSSALLPYELIAPFWSDGAFKTRWVSVPHATKMGFAPAGEWTFPAGTVFVKHFELPTDPAQTASPRRLETRLLVRDSTGGVYGVTYKWRPDQTDADLLTQSLTEPILLRTTGGLRTQLWFYPSPADCRTCHTTNAGGVLGVKTRQLNRNFYYVATQTTDNQLRTWNHLGLFEPRLNEADLSSLPRLTDPQDVHAALELRSRSYLDANCAQCHRPGGVVSHFDARFDTPLPQQNLINGPVVIDQGIDNARAIAPNDPWRSLILLRVNSLEPTKMPPLAHEIIDQRAVELLANWIHSLPGPPVLPPPAISPQAGQFKPGLKVALQHPDPAAEIRFTLNGNAPGKNSSLYKVPIELTGSATVRARAYKTNFTRSIAVQETFILE